MKARMGAPKESTVTAKAERLAPLDPHAWRPFRFTGLERVSGRAQRLLKSAEWLLPNVTAPTEVLLPIKRLLDEMLEERVQLEPESLHVTSHARARQAFSQPTFLAALAVPPNKARALLEVELGLAHKVIDLLLGASGETVGFRPLTDIEEGMMTYVMVEMLRVLSPGLDPALSKPRLDFVAHGLNEVSTLVADDEPLVMLQLRASVGALAGAVRLMLPESLVVAMTARPDAAVQTARRRADALAKPQRLRCARTLLRAEVAQVEIGARDLAQLQGGDVVLVEALRFRPDKGEAGDLHLRVGLGRIGFIDAALSVVDGSYRAEVRRVVLGGPSSASSSLSQAEAGGNESSVPLGDAAEQSTSSSQAKGRRDVDGNADGADLLNDIPLQLSIELGRVPITAEDLVALKVGHVFDLRRTPSEPVDLSVNGRLVARGELVEVDGALGVRIVSLGV